MTWTTGTSSGGATVVAGLEHAGHSAAPIAATEIHPPRNLMTPPAVVVGGLYAIVAVPQVRGHQNRKNDRGEGHPDEPFDDRHHPRRRRQRRDVPVADGQQRDVAEVEEAREIERRAALGEP